MAIDSVFNKIELFLKKENVSPLLVDVSTSADLGAISKQFKTSGNEFVRAADYCKNDELPRIVRLLNDLQLKDANIFLTGLTTFLKLKGTDVLKAELDTLLHMTTAGHVVLLSYQCSQYLESIINNDRRLLLSLIHI